ncbi:MAG: DUF4249 domain-containing protein [Chitinophagaceae bacterium]|nr:MAG: DUF4249 domain-containing protein [Chitinophagaceae bacterium]
MKKLIYILFVLILAGCKDSYDLPLNVPATGYLVVDGVINPIGQTTISLSRSVRLVDSFNINYVRDASVTVEGEDNSSQELLHNNDGRYEATALNLNPAVKYRLHIWHNGKEYTSAYLPVKQTPAIDSISWDRDEEGVHIYADAKGNANTSGYYRWDYEEDWEFHSAFAPSLKYNLVPLAEYIFRNQDVDKSRFTCYQSSRSTSLEILSTAKITRDTTHYRFLTIPSASWKLSILYAVYLRQYSLSKEGFEYLSKMKKNTEQTGSIFDAQPSELRGNITCVEDPSEPVIGFIEISEVHAKRRFIKASEVPSWGYRQACNLESMPNNSDSILFYGYPEPVIPDLVAVNGAILRLFTTSRECVDCTQRGTLTKPPFWP